jgi:YbgC/YbaW family acyl-CoA thioester hydrolase
VAFETRARLRFYDMDRAGMVFHGAYARLFQDAFEDLMEHVGFVEKDLEPELGVRVPVVDHRMRFPDPPEGDELAIAVTVTDIGASSAEFHLEARDDGTTVAVGEITRVCVDRSGQPTPIPDALRDAWAEHQA